MYKVLRGVVSYEKFFSKNIGIFICVCLVLIVSVESKVSVEHGGWESTKKTIYSEMEALSRNVDTPAYYSLHYRLRKAYFSVEPHQNNPIIFL